LSAASLGLHARPIGGASSTPPHHLAVFRGLRRGWKGGEKRVVEGKEFVLCPRKKKESLNIITAVIILRCTNLKEIQSKSFKNPISTIFTRY